MLSFVALSSVASMKLLEKKAEKSTIKYAKDKEKLEDNSGDLVVENNHDEKSKIAKNLIIIIIAKIQIQVWT